MSQVSRCLDNGRALQELLYEAARPIHQCPEAREDAKSQEMTRASNSQLSFADLEFVKQGVRLEPALRAISEFIDLHAELVEMVRRDLLRGLKRPDTGRNGLTAQEVLRSLTLMRVKNWDYRELRERIADGYTLRHFTHFNSKARSETRRLQPGLHPRHPGGY